MEPPEAILQRVVRVLSLHQTTALSADAAIAPADVPQPSPIRLFEGYAKIPLPTSLISASTPALSLLHQGPEVVPDSQLQPPQDLRTLATWLFLGGGNVRPDLPEEAARVCPSDGGVFPCEIYVAAFAVAGLEPGFYHFNAREFALYQLRDGQETLAQIKRGRPDLEFLQVPPAVLLVSTIFCRSTWAFGRRGYRHALTDAGRLIQNLATAASGLGMQTQVRLAVNAQDMRQLIGLAPDAQFPDAEAVQGTVIWADAAEKLIGPATEVNALGPMPTIPRAPLAEIVAAYDEITAVHEDCVAPEATVREVRPPLTELTPLPSDFPVQDLPQPQESDADDPGPAVDRLLLTVTPARYFAQNFIPRDRLWQMARAAFRWETGYPFFPDGPHAALVRPFWMIQGVSGMDEGVWFYDPMKDAWSALRLGPVRAHSRNFACSDPRFGSAAAVCFIVANLQRLMCEGGPDLYRLAHLEAGAAAQRLYLAAGALHLACCATGTFLDESIRTFFGLDRTPWQPLHVVAVGLPADEFAPI